MKLYYTLIVCLVLALVLLVSGCGKSVEGPSHKDVKLSAEEFVLREFIRMSELDKRDKDEKPVVCDSVSDGNTGYVLVQYMGTGSELRLFKYRKINSGYEMVDNFSAEQAVSGGISVNTCIDGSSHLYFGNINDTHWDSVSEHADKFNPSTILFVADSETYQKDVNGKQGYIAKLPWQMKDFSISDSNENKLLDMKTYLAQGYSVSDLGVT